MMMAKRGQSANKENVEEPRQGGLGEAENEPVLKGHSLLEKRKMLEMSKQQVDNSEVLSKPESNNPSEDESSEEEIELSSDSEPDREPRPIRIEHFFVSINSEELNQAHFKPSLRHFTFPNHTYINSLLEQPEVIAQGIFKVTAPQGWSPSLSKQDCLDRLASRQVKPLIQIVTEHKSGVFTRKIGHAKATSFKEFDDDAMKNEISYGDEPLNVVNMTKNILEQITERKPKFVIDYKGSLFDDDAMGINLKTGVTEAFDRETDLPGITTPMLCCGMAATVFCAQKEDMELHSVTYLHWGSPKIWYSIQEDQIEQLEKVIKETFPLNFKNCKNFIRHKSLMLSPAFLEAKGVQVDCTVQSPGDYVVTNPRGYHWGYDSGFNVAETVHFGSRKWPFHGPNATKCNCSKKTKVIDMEWK